MRNQCLVLNYRYSHFHCYLKNNNYEMISKFSDDKTSKNDTITSNFHRASAARFENSRRFCKLKLLIHSPLPGIGTLRKHDRDSNNDIKNKQTTKRKTSLNEYNNWTSRAFDGNANENVT